MVEEAQAVDPVRAGHAPLESLDNGMPLSIARGIALPLTIATFRYLAGWADKNHGKSIPRQMNPAR